MITILTARCISCLLSAANPTTFQETSAHVVGAVLLAATFRVLIELLIATCTCFVPGLASLGADRIACIIQQCSQIEQLSGTIIDQIGRLCLSKLPYRLRDHVDLE